jgi:GT2 family glycosyltransferase
MTNMEHPKVAVVILNWNGKEFLEKFLPHVLKFCPEYARVYIADNASTDDSIAFLSHQYPELSIIQHDQNYGYTGGYNKALSIIDSEYYVLLNSDIKVDRPWIEPVIDLMDKDERIAACQPKIRSYLKPEYFEYAGAAGGFLDLFGYPFCRGRVFNVLEKDDSQYDDNSEIFWATGACMFVRASSFREAGELDDDFFAHMEEIDLCWRFKRMGLKVVCCTDSVVFHVGGGTLPKNSPRKTYFNFRNNLYLIAKNLPRYSFYPVMISRFFLDHAAALKFFMTGYRSDCFAVLKAWAHALRLLGKKRKQGKLFGNKKVSCIYLNSVAIMYFIFRRRKYSQLK